MKKRKFQEGGYTGFPAPTNTSSPLFPVQDSPSAGIKGYASPELPQVPVGAPTPAPVVTGRPDAPITPQFNDLYGQGDGRPRLVGMPSAPSPEVMASMRANDKAKALLNPSAARPSTEKAGVASAALMQAMANRLSGTPSQTRAGGRQMPALPRSRVPIPAKGRPTMAEGGKVKSYAKGGSVRGGGCEQRGKTKGRMV